jgi:hypothetical protein
MNELWKEPMEEDGLTLGPEEALQKEIEKSKILKVDRLRLRDEIEKLKSEKYDLSQKNQKLKDRLTKFENSASGKTGSSSANSLVFTLVFGFLALLWFITRN